MRKKRDEIRESFRIRSVVDLHHAIEYLHTMYGVEDAELIFPDALPLVSVVFRRQVLKSGEEQTQLILSDEWPRGMRASKGFEIYDVGDEQP